MGKLSQIVIEDHFQEILKVEMVKNHFTLLSVSILQYIDSEKDARIQLCVRVLSV